jgi:zinc transport system substrate-binding protein
MIKRIIPLLIAVMLVSCGTNENVDESKATLSVSILPQKYFIEEIAGDLFNINVMIPPGASPATYEPTPMQLTSLAVTDLYLKIGYTGFELSWMDKLISTNETMKVVDLSEGVDLIIENVHQHGDHQHGSVDPHIWLSPKNAKIISANIYKTLSETYPEHNSEFSTNLKALDLKIDSLDSYITETVSNLEKKSFMTYHPALSYFARDYGLIQLPMELEGKTPTSAYLKKLVDQGIVDDVSVIFLQMQFDQHNAEVLAKEIGAELIQINPLDVEWYKQMVFIADKLKSAI